MKTLVLKKEDKTDSDTKDQADWVCAILARTLFEIGYVVWGLRSQGRLSTILITGLMRGTRSSPTSH